MFNAGSSIGLGQNKSEGSSSQSPWGPQADQLMFGFDQARGLYEQGPYTGRYTSEMGPYEQQLMNQQNAYYQPGGAGYQAQANQQQFANQAMGALPQAMDMYTDIYGNPITSDSITAGMNEDIMAQQQAQATAAAQDALAGQMQSSQTNAAQSGNLGSSTSQKIEAQSMMDASTELANMYNQIYQQEYANTQGNMQNQQQVGLATAGAMTGIAGMGSSANLQAQQMQETGFATQGSVADRERAQADREIENAYRQFNAGWDNLNNFMGVVGSANWGSEGTTSSRDRSTNLSASGGMSM